MTDDDGVLSLNHRYRTPAFIARCVGLILSICTFSTIIRAEIGEFRSADFVTGAGKAGLDYSPTVAFTFSKYFTATAGGTLLNFNEGVGNFDANSQGKISNMQAVLNWHPLAGNFHLSAGVFVSSNRITVSGQPKRNSGFALAATSITSEQVGAYSSDVDLTSNVEPYFGLGWSTQPLFAGIRVFADFGILFTSLAQTTPGTSGMISSNPAFQFNFLHRDRDAIRDLKAQRFHPIAQLGLSHQF
jgi:hypothetical protein